MTNCNFLKVILMVQLMAFAAVFALPAAAWTIDESFENGFIGDQVTTPSDAQGRTIYSSDLAHTGLQSAQLNIIQGTEGFGGWGGREFFPTELGEGDEIWVRLRMFVPEDFDFTTNFALKFLRFHVKKSDGSHLGYTDVYIKNDQTLFYQNELYSTAALILNDKVQADLFRVGEIVKGEVSGATAKVLFKKDGKIIYKEEGTGFSRWEYVVGEVSGARAQITSLTSNSVQAFPAANSIKKGVWESFIYNIRYSATSPRVRFYKYEGGSIDAEGRKTGGKYELIFDDSTDYTLSDPTDKVDAFLLFTYWNGSAPKTQHLYVDDLWLSTEKPVDLVVPVTPSGWNVK